MLTSEPSLSEPLCRGRPTRVQFTCTGNEVPFVLNWVLNDSTIATYSFASTHTYPFPLDPEPPTSTFPPGVVINVTSATLCPNDDSSIDYTTILDTSDVAVLDHSLLNCEDSAELKSNVIDIEVDFRGECSRYRFMQQVHAQKLFSLVKAAVVLCETKKTLLLISPNFDYRCHWFGQMAG